MEWWHITLAAILQLVVLVVVLKLLFDKYMRELRVQRVHNELEAQKKVMTSNKYTTLLAQNGNIEEQPPDPLIAQWTENNQNAKGLRSSRGINKQLADPMVAQK